MVNNIFIPFKFKCPSQLVRIYANYYNREAISRAIRGHLLVDAALHVNLIGLLYPAKDELSIHPRDVEKEQAVEDEQQREDYQEEQNEYIEQQHKRFVKL